MIKSSRAKRRRDEEVNEEGNADENVEVNEEDSERTIEEEKAGESTPANFEWKQVEGEPDERKAEIDSSGSRDQFYDAEVGETTTVEDVPTAPVVTEEKKKGKLKTRRVDPPGILDSDFLQLQVEMDRALKANKRFLVLLKQVKPQPLAPSSP
ncbi:hypothetical protein Dimus_026982 [Dionaea muscipula]